MPRTCPGKIGERGKKWIVHGEGGTLLVPQLLPNDDKTNEVKLGEVKNYPRHQKNQGSAGKLRLAATEPNSGSESYKDGCVSGGFSYLACGRMTQGMRPRE